MNRKFFLTLPATPSAFRAIISSLDNFCELPLSFINWLLSPETHITSSKDTKEMVILIITSIFIFLFAPFHVTYTVVIRILNNDYKLVSDHANKLAIMKKK